MTIILKRAAAVIGTFVFLCLSIAFIYGDVSMINPFSWEGWEGGYNRFCVVLFSAGAALYPFNK